MKIRNKQFGEIEFLPENVLKFENGLFGFEELKDYLLIKADNELFFWLNSIDQPEMVFPLVGLRLVDESFPQTEDSEAFGIVTLNPDPKNITVNMKAPVYINQEMKTGYQKIIDKDDYPVKYLLFTD